MITPHWEHFEHQADMGVRGFGNSREQAFEQAALAMSAIITELSLVEPREEVTLSCEEDDQELLLADWLNALVYEMSTRKMLFSRFKVEIDNGRLRASAWGETTDIERHQPAVEIKGATYTELAVQQIQDQWLAQCVVDV
jgi:tRNA nucleotidyltransferase (CCA-adding enzyme)